MDVHQHAFLARQPSAALKPRGDSWGLPKRGLALILANAMFWQPLLVQASAIEVSAPGTTVGQAGNGVPVVNIATPNGSGLSHNQFRDYNVGANGLILNNATSRTQPTQLGGIILGNPNLKGGAASIILNEITGGSPSQLRGYTEVAGQSAKVIVANPYGISCNGCGFINTPHVTLTTGRPMVHNGHLDRYQVDGGAVTIDGHGLNADNVDRFEIITRSARINAQINARNLTLITGRNDVDAQTLNAVARADDGSARPTLAIDSSALGGMYAGAIKLVGTEAGVGVKLDGMLMASGGDIQLDTRGRLSLAQVRAAGAVNVKAASLDAQAVVYAGTTMDMQVRDDLNNNQRLAARDHIKLSSGGRLTNSGAIEAGVNADDTLNGAGDINLVAHTLSNTNNGIIASRTLTASAQALNNQGGTLAVQQHASVTAATLDNQNNGRIHSSGSLNVNAGQLRNAQGGSVSANGALQVVSDSLDNKGGQLTSRGNARLNINGALDNRQHGLISANEGLTITAAGPVHNSDNGSIHSQNGELKLKAAHLNNARGKIQGQSEVSLDLGGSLDNQSGSVIAQTGHVDLKAVSIDNRGGTLASLKGALKAQTRGGWLRNDADLNNNRQAGTIEAHGLDLLSARINNNGGRISALTGDATVATEAFDNRDGSLHAKSTVKVTGGSFDNSGQVRGQIAGGKVELNLSGALNNHKGVIESGSALKLNAASVNNQQGQLRAVGADGTTVVEVSGLFDNRSGALEVANTDLNFRAGSFQNADGQLLHVGTGNLGIAMANLNSAGGNLVTQGGLTVDQHNWTNSSVIQAARLNVNVNTLDQTAGGQLLASERFTGRGHDWTTHGLIASDGRLDLNLSGKLHSTGRTTSQGEMNLAAGELMLAPSASIASGGNATVNVAGMLSNQGQITSAGDLAVAASRIDNAATLGSAQNLTVHTGSLLNDHALIFSGGDMSLQVDSLHNRYADIYSAGRLTIDRDGRGALASSILNQSSSIQSDGDLSLAADSIQNVRAVLDIKDDGVYTAKITELPCTRRYVGDCKGKNRNGLFEVVQRSRLEVVPGASAASDISTGGDLYIRGGQFLNSSSTVGAAGNLTAHVDSFINQGVETGEREDSRTYVSARHKLGGHRASAAKFTDKYWVEGKGFNESNTGGLLPALAHYLTKVEREVASLHKTTQVSTGDQRYAGVIQAGGAVSITAANDIDNSVVRPGYIYVGSGAKNTAALGAGSSGREYATRISINQQLPPELAQQQVNPLSLPGFSQPKGNNGLFRLRHNPATDSIADGADFGLSPGWSVTRVKGLPSTSVPSRRHNYLIETRPALTNLKQFMGSDYLLSKLGYNPDDSVKRLGDGFYEQRLIQRAVVARTGQRFLAGQNTDEKMFKHLMDNAISSKQQLNLAVGVSLTSEQVAALTHDIVWLEKSEINGESLLVPVLYLAHAKKRLAPNGALIASNDINLLAGQDLKNVGTLRADSNLSAHAEKNASNSGLIESGDRLNLQAGNHLANRAGGIIAGQNVSVKARLGDVLNERTVTHHQSSGGQRSEERGFADTAARIEAANQLSVYAGRDVNNVGGLIQSGGGSRIEAGRDVNVVSAEQTSSDTVGLHHRAQSTRQHGSGIATGGDLNIRSGRDVNLIASRIDAGRDAAITAAQNLTLSSAADEQHSYGKTKKGAHQEDHASQVSSVVKAGDDVKLGAGHDLTLVASTVSAGNEAYLVAGHDLALKSAENHDYRFSSKSKKSSSGSTFRLDESDRITNIGSLIHSGGDSVLTAGENLLLAGSVVAADEGAATLNAGKDVQILAMSDSESARSERKTSKSSWGGFKSSKVHGQVDEKRTVAVGSMVSGETINIAAGQDVRVTGSALVSTADLAVEVGRDLTIDAAQNTFSRTDMRKEKSRDLTGMLTANNLGLDDLTGNHHLSISSRKHNGTAQEMTLTGSTVGASAGNVTLTAGRELSVTASDLVSTRDMTLSGSSVTLAAGLETASQSTVDTYKSLSVGRVIGGAAVDTAKSIRAGVEAAKNAEDPRLAAVKTAQVALNAYKLGGQTSDALDQSGGFKDKQGGTASNGSLIKIGTELGKTNSTRTSEYRSETAKQSTLSAGSGLSIVATGAAPNTLGNIHVIGSKLTAANATLVAKNDITLESAQSTTERKNDSKNDKTSIGASFNLGSQNGFTLDLGAQIAKGMGSGSSVTQVNSTLDTGALVLKSGRDTTLAGAQVRADSINANVGGNLNIASRQDTDTQRSKQGSAGAGASICVPPFCYGATVAASGSVSTGNMNSDFKAVTEQTGFFAGQGGYTIDVGKNTTLHGAVIASEASADQNLLTTDRLFTSDIKNVSKIKSSSASASISSDGSSIGMGKPMGLVLSDAESSKTRAAISEGTIVVRSPEGASDLVGLNRDTANANEQLDKPDEKAMRERMDLINSTAELATSVAGVIGDLKQKESEDPDSDTAAAARLKLRQQGIHDPTPEQVTAQVQRDYGPGSSFQRTTHTVTAVLQGIAGANPGAVIASAAAPFLAQRVKELTAGDDAANLMAHAVLGAVLAEAGGNSALVGAGGALAAEATASLIRARLYGNVSNAELTVEQKQTISALSTLAAGLAGSAVGKDALSAVAAAQIGKNAVENNQLSILEPTILKNKQREFAATCTGVASTECQTLRNDINQLLTKASSTLKQEVLGGSDFIQAQVVEVKPGQIVPCAISGNQYCVVSNQSVKTELGHEWLLTPATHEQSLKGIADHQAQIETVTTILSEKAREMFDAGCGGMGLVGVGCQLHMAGGGKNLITGEVATGAERAWWAAQAVLNSAGLAGAIAGGVRASAGGKLGKVDEVAGEAAFGGAKGTSAWDNAISKADGDFGHLPPVRQNYVKDVHDLQLTVDKMRAGGASTEEIAKHAYNARNELKIKYREYTPPDMLNIIDARNVERYGNKIGPTFDDLVKKGRTLDQIIESSTRAGGGDLF